MSRLNISLTIETMIVLILHIKKLLMINLLKYCIKCLFYGSLFLFAFCQIDKGHMVVCIYRGMYVAFDLVDGYFDIQMVFMG